MLKFGFIMLLSLSIAACSGPFASNQPDAYLKSKNSPKLVTPPPLNQSEISSFYVLPDAEGEKKVTIEP